MSASSIKAFFAKVAKDKSLQAKLNASHTKILKASKAKAAVEVVKIAAAAGFKFTAAELAKACRVKAKKPAKAALRDVTGQSYCGMGYMYACMGSNANYACGIYSYY